jgi:hypothetical protein
MKTNNVEPMKADFNHWQVDKKLKDTQIVPRRNAEQQAEYDKKLAEEKAEWEEIKRKNEAEAQAKKEAKEKAIAEEKLRRKNVYDYVD